MATTSPLARIPLPQTPDSDQVPTDLMTMAQYMETMLNLRFANAAERTAYLTAAGLGTGIRGMTTWVDSPGRDEKFNGTLWLPLITNVPETDTFAVKGTNWDGVSPTREMKRRSTATVGASGLFSVPLATAYPNGLLYASITPGDNTGGLGFVMLVQSTTSISALGGQAFGPAGAVVPATNNIIVSYNTVGW